MTPPTVTPRLGTALLREIPRFFGGFPAALQEVLQNSLRAGASQIDFVLRGDTLTITDNGCGLDDPQVLLTAAQSGWDGHVVEPAGLGALSVLNPDFAAQVTYRSRAWQFSLTPDAFAQGASVPVQPAEAQGGFQVTVKLNRTITEAALRANLTAHRGYAPVTVRLNGEELPPTTPRGTRLDTPAGVLYLQPSSSSALPQAVWEHFPLSAKALHDRLTEHGPLVNARLRKHTFLLLLDPSSGVRPKLPDRNALLDDEALHRAAQDLSAAIAALADREMRALIPALGADVLSAGDLRAVPDGQGAVMRAFLTAQGYVPTTLSQPGAVWAYVGDDSDDDSSGGWTEDWVKEQTGTARASMTATEMLLATLRGQGHALPYGSLAATAPLTVQASGLRPFLTFPSQGTPVLALAAQLRVQGQQVPVAVHVECRDEPGAPVCPLVLAGTAEEAETYVRAHLDQVGGLLLLALLDTYDLREAELDDTDTEFTALSAGERVLRQLIAACFPERAAAQQEVARLGTAAYHLSTALSALRLVGQDDAALAEAVAPAVTRLETEEHTQRARIRELVTAHRLAS